MEVDRKIVFFNDAEAVAEEAGKAEETVTRQISKKRQGKREEDFYALTFHAGRRTEGMFRKNDFKQLPDEVLRRYEFIL